MMDGASRTAASLVTSDVYDTSEGVVLSWLYPLLLMPGGWSTIESRWHLAGGMRMSGCTKRLCTMT
jgi:hypothetical protein